MRRGHCFGMRMTGLCLSLCAAAGAATPQQVDEAIVRARSFLHSAQQDGNWELVRAQQPEPRPDFAGRIKIEDIINSSQYGGITALVTYALLAAGDAPQESSIESAVNWLRRSDMAGTYAVAMRAQIWRYLPRSTQNTEAARRDRDLLVANMRKNPEWRGFYRYTATDYGYDHSASQYAVLGMWACEQRGVEAPKDYWKIVEDAWIKNQERSGGWSYTPLLGPEAEVRASMTAAGLATLFITQDYLHHREGIECKGNITNKSIDAGMKWMVDHFDKVFTGDWPYYTLYGVERIGVASGYKYFGTIDWYARGADDLVRKQEKSGSWGNVYDTAMALLFLVRGRAPVLMNKLEYHLAGPAATSPNLSKANKSEKASEAQKKANWNQRPRDAANLTRWISKQFERELNWQIVDLHGNPDDLLDAPILYIAGNQVLNFTPQEEARLKYFVEQGGLILGNADCLHIGFVNSFKKLGTKLFAPQEFRELPASHIVYNNLFQRSKWKSHFSVQALSNGVRELMVLLPNADPARDWQSGAYAGREQLHDLFANLFLYLSDHKDLRFKGDLLMVHPDPQIKPTRTIKLARIEHFYNWDPEPGGWRRMAGILHNDAQIALDVIPVKLGEGQLSQHKLAHLTTTGKLKITDAQRRELKNFIAAGGTLIADACGGVPEAATALEQELLLIQPGELAAIPPRHEIFSHLGTITADDLAYRPYAVKQYLGQQKGSRLRGIFVNSRLAIIYSREDFSVGMVGSAVDGILGYTPKSAAALVKSIVLYAGKRD